MNRPFFCGFGTLLFEHELDTVIRFVPSAVLCSSAMLGHGFYTGEESYCTCQR